MSGKGRRQLHIGNVEATTPLSKQTSNGGGIRLRRLLVGAVVIAALVMSILAITLPKATTIGGGVGTINGIIPNAGTGDFTIGGALGITIVPGPNGVIIQNDMTIALAAPAEFLIAGSPLDGTGGTLTITKAAQSANHIWAGPSTGAAAPPTFRALVDADIPNALSLTMLTVAVDTLLGSNTSCVVPLLPSCYDISNQQCVGGPLGGNCLPPSAAFDNLIVGTLTILNGTSNNGTFLNNTFLGDTFLNGTLMCVGSGSISSACLNLGGYTCPMGVPLAESCIPASLVMYDVSVTNNLTVNTVTCAGGPLPANCIPFGNVVMDNLATPTYPTSPQTEGVWYGPGAKAGCAANTNIAIGLNPIANATNTIAIGNGPQCSYEFDVAIGFMSTSNINSISIGPLSIATNGSIAIGVLNDANLGGIAIGNLATANGVGAISIGGLLTNSNGDYSVALGGYADSSEYSVAVGPFALAGYHSVSIGGFAGRLSPVDYSVSIGSTVFGYAVRSGALDVAHAFALNINNATVNPGTLGITVNNAPYQLPLYASDFATTPTAAAVTALSVTSAKKQFFTGTTTQTVVLPDVSTLAAGFEFKISNLSTGAVTVDVFGGGGTVATLAGTTAPTAKWGFFTCINVAGVGTAGWAYDPGA